ncbi:glycosyltransferase family 4 protein [Candidatus Saccharibacteria bacterium]|nr:glycosyltransferase family 4 protein [Candidatus Saccharibacteria bacterium]MBQ7802999.1 glycosyltransferase family 4 protein [Candidatus Saccharibacteria bacterium]
MKILMLGWELPPHNSGGLGVACLNLSRALAKDGADIDFVVPYEAEHKEIKFMRVLSASHLDPLFRFGIGAYDSDKIEDLIIPDIHIKGAISKDQVSIRQIQKTYCDFVEKYLMEFKPDIVHAHDWLTFEAGVLAKKNFGIPLIAHVHATEFDRAGGNGGNPLVHEIEYEGLLLADKILAVSEATKHIIHEKYAIPLKKIDVVYNSLDEGFLNSEYHFMSEEYKYIKDLKKKGFTVVSTVGRFTIQKGLSHLLHAAAKAVRKNPKLLFVLAGDGEEKEELINLAAELGISRNVIFTGFIRGKKLRDIYEISDIFVMSSISEPFGLTALEAAHHGDVLILTKQSGVSEVIRSSFRYDFWDEDKLANEILAIAKSPALKETLKNSIHSEYRKISWDDVAKKCLKAYNEVDKHKRV